MTWRDRLATEWMYFDQGRSLVNAVVQIFLLPTGILAFLGLRIYWAALAGPCLAVFGLLLGRLHNHYGWLKHLSNVGVREGMSRPSVVSTVQSYRMFQWAARVSQVLGIEGPEWNHVPRDVPREVFAPFEVPHESTDRPSR